MCALVVTYRPDAVRLLELVESLAEQVNRVLIVDNSGFEDPSVEKLVLNHRAFGDALSVVRLRQNCGIGSAINVGLEAARAAGFDYVLLSDQDSLPSSGMVDELLRTDTALRKEGLPVGLVSPEYVDEVTGHAFGFQVQRPGRFFYSVAPPRSGEPWIEILSAITSGSLIRLDVFDVVGEMREDYFIDYVDTEWCHRAIHFGYKLFGTSRAVLSQRLGEDQFPVWYLKWRPYNGYSPQRLYYRFRNFIAILKADFVPGRWKLRALWYWLGNLYAYVLFSPRRLVNIRYIAWGLWDGLRGHMGPMRTGKTADLVSD